MLDWLTDNVVSIIALAVSGLAYYYYQARKAARQARKAASFGTRLEAINHVRTALYDVTKDGNITTNTVASIREALQISQLVFGGTIIAELDQAHRTASRLQHKPFERLTDQDFND